MMLSASVSSAGILKIIGTESADRIVVSADATFINILDVNINGAAKYFSLSDITRIDVRAGAGDDVILIDSSLDVMNYRALIDAGAGNDRITTGAGNDKIVGGDGDDLIYANAGDDHVDSAVGRDTIWAGAGDDLLAGGAGNDIVWGESGADRIDGGRGNDRIDAGAGNDVLSDNAGRDTINAGDGGDTGTFKDNGIIHGGAGNDSIISSGKAQLFGDGNDDQLTGSLVWGNSGADTLTGTGQTDRLHGNAGNDLIYGRGGNDLIFGDDGNDAIYGGAGNDSLRGGDGDDNLYGDDGITLRFANRAQARRYDPGRDIGMGETGSDWFEPTHQWLKIDGNKSDREALRSQIRILNDPSLGSYGSSFYGSVSVNDSSSGSTLLLKGGGALLVAGENTYSGGTFFSTAAAEFKTLGDFGFLATGRYDTTKNKIVSGELSSTQAQQLKRTIVQLPPGWQIGEMTSTANDVVWYRVSSPSHVQINAGVTVTVPANAPLPSYLRVGTSPVFTVGGGATSGRGGIIVVGGNISLTPSGTAATVDIPATTAELFDGIEGGAYRFLALRRGTIVFQAGELSDAKSFDPQSRLLALPGSGEIRIAGESSVYHFAHSFAHLPTAATDGRGILVEEGALWLPADGGAPMFTSN